MYKLIRTVKIAFATLLLATNLLHAQAPLIQWQKSFGGLEEDNASSVWQTTDGGYIVAGTSLSHDGDITNTHVAHDYWLVKTDAAGQLLWQVSLGGHSSDWATAMQQTTDGGYIVAGYTMSNDVDVSGNHGGVDFWVVKLNSTGTIQWQKALGGSGGDYANSIQQCTDGGYIVAGYTNSSNGDVTGLHGIANDYWVVKLNSAGNIQWQKTLGGTYSDEATSVIQCTDGGYIVAGYTLSKDGDVTDLHGAPDSYHDYWIVKLNSAGAIEWQKTLGGPGVDKAYAIKQCSDDGYIVAGYTMSNGGDVTATHGSYQDYWVVKINSTGSIQWQKTLGGTDDDRAYSVLQSSDGGYVVAGYANSTNGDVTNNHGGPDYWIVKLNSNGDMEWQKAMGGAVEDHAYAIQQCTDGGYIVAGNSGSSNGDITVNHGTYDYWVVKLSGVTAIDETTEDGNIGVFPVPAQNKVSIDAPYGADIKLLNLQGETIRHTVKADIPLVFDITTLANGIYIVEIKHATTVTARKVVIQR